MPTKPKKPCSYPGCPKLTNNRFCEEHQKIMDDRYNKYERPYNSSESYGYDWRKQRNRYIKFHPFCEKCLEEGKIVVATEVHHKVPIKNGGTHNADNLMSLCKSCHSRITVQMGDRWGRKKEVAPKKLHQPN